MIGTDNTIDMSDVSSEAVICMLKYVYSGTVTLNREVFSQVLNLAQGYVLLSAGLVDIMIS